MELEAIESASAVESYNPNAELGYGAGGAPATQDYGSVVNGTIQQLNQTAYNQQVLLHNQNIQDRDASMALFAQGKIAGDIDEIDRPEMEKVRAEMEDLYSKNPNLKKDPEVFAKMQTLVNKFGELNVLGNTRDLEFKKQRLGIAAEKDPDKQKMMIDHLENERKKGIKHIPEPYVKGLDWTPEVITPVFEPAFMGSKTENGKDGLPYTTKQYRTNVKQFVDYYSPQNFLNGANNTKPNELAKWAENAYAMPELQDVKYLNAANKMIEKINADSGAVEGSKLFITPLANQDANGKWIVEANPLELAKKLNLVGSYKDFSAPAELDPNYQKVRTDKAQEIQYRSAANENNAQAERTRRLMDDEEAKLKAEARDATLRGDKQEYENKIAMAASSKPVIDAFSTFDEAQSAKGYKTASVFIKDGGLSATAQATLQGVIGGNDTLQITEIPASNTGARKMLSTRPEGKNKVLTAPAKMYSIKDPNDPDNTILVGLDKAGNLYKTSNLSQGINDLISFETNNAVGKDRVALASAGQLYVEELQGVPGEARLTKMREKLNASPGTSGPATNVNQATPVATPKPANTQPTTTVSSLSIKIPANYKDPSVSRVVGGVPQIFHNGKWRKVVSSNSQTGTINLE